MTDFTASGSSVQPKTLDSWSAGDKPELTAPRPDAPPKMHDASTLGDLTVSSIADHDQGWNLKPTVSSSLDTRGNLRPPVNSSRSTTAATLTHQKPSMQMPPTRKALSSVSASPTKQASSTGKTPIVKKVTHSTPTQTACLKSTKTPLGRTGSTASSRLPPSKAALTTSKKLPASANTSFAMNESVMSFVPSGEVDAEGNQLSKQEEERMRIEIEVAYCRAMQYQILRAKLRKAAEAQSRDVIAQTCALWEETERLRESATEKRAEAADIRRQRELHKATTLGGACVSADDDVAPSQDTPNALSGHSTRRSRGKGHPHSAKATENAEPSADLRIVGELLGPIMKDMSLLAGSVDKTRHGLPMKDVVNASSKQLVGALHHLEGALVDMPKMAKLAVSSTATSNDDSSLAGEAIRSYRDSVEGLGRECVEAADVLQIGGEMACHMLALEECSRLKATSSSFSK